MAAVTVILLIVGMTSRFILYLGQAVAGELATDVLLLLIFYRLPDFLLVILPLALFLGILLAYGRMYAENEMVILIGSGYSQVKLLLTTMAISLLVLLVVAALSLQVAPWGQRNSTQLKLDQDQLTEIDLIVAGQFQVFAGGDRVTFAERIQNNQDQGRSLLNVFVAISDEAVEGESNGPRIILAESARSEIDEETGTRFMRLENVLQYDGTPGRADFSVGQFDVQSILLPEPISFALTLERESLPTKDLLGSPLAEYKAELQWRISLILLIPIVTMIAVPLSKVNPRQGRFSKLVPAALLYATYIVLLQVSKDLIADESLSPVIGMWWVHLLFAGIAWAAYRHSQLGKLFFFGSSA